MRRVLHMNSKKRESLIDSIARHLFAYNSSLRMVECPICGKTVKARDINDHIDSGCASFTEIDIPLTPLTPYNKNTTKKNVATFFQTPAARRSSPVSLSTSNPSTAISTTTVTKNSFVNPVTPILNSSTDFPSSSQLHNDQQTLPSITPLSGKRSFDNTNTNSNFHKIIEENNSPPDLQPMAKKHRACMFKKTVASAPLAERMRPTSLDDVCGQDIVGPQGVIRALVEQDQLPSLILWGGPGTGKTTIARCLATHHKNRFVEINSSSSGTAEWKKIFAEARRELSVTGRKTILFCDEIHRFSKSQQDVFLAPVESGQITLIGATTENPSFKLQSALLSRCRTFTLSKLTPSQIQRITERALANLEPPPSPSVLQVIDNEFITYLSNFADGDARVSLNLLELALSLCSQPSRSEMISKDEIKSALTKTLVYDRAGDQHYDTISAFHKSIRGSDPDAALYYLARMLQSGEDPLYVARRLVVIASEDIGLADNSMLPLATSAYMATEKIGMPECRIALAHATVALCLAPKSTRSYRGLNSAFAALQEPGVAALPIPISLRNAPTRMMKELGHGEKYKYNPNYKDGKVRQDYLPPELIGRTFLGENDLGTEIDPEAWP